MSRPRLSAADSAEMMADTQALAAQEAVPMPVETQDMSGGGASAATEAEPAAETPANDAAEPANDTAAPAETPPPAGKSTSERLAAIKKAQQRAVAERRAIAEERQQVQAMREAVEREVSSIRETLQREIASVREAALKDVSPIMEAQKLLASDDAESRLQGLKALGFSYEDTTQMMLSGGGLTPQQIEAKLRREYDERLSAQEKKILATIEEREAKAREQYESQQAQAQRERARNAAVAHASTLVAVETHPLTVGLIEDGEYSREDIGEAIVKIVEQDYSQRYTALAEQGLSEAAIRQRLKPLDYSAATGMLESSLESDLARLERARQRKLSGKDAPDASKLGAEGNAPESVSQSKASQTPGHPTLTSSESTQVASKRGPKSMRELRQQVYQENPVLLATGGRR